MINGLSSQYLSYDNNQESSLIHIEHPIFNAVISPFGGQVLSFTPKNNSETSANHDLLWLSNQAMLSGEKAIRGGIPLCWPWFGPATGKNIGKPQHGYIRNLMWDICSYAENDSEISIGFKPQLSPELITEIGLMVEVHYQFSDKLNITLTTTNITNTEQPLSQAIHSYFNIDDIRQCDILGLQSLPYLDQLTGTEAVEKNEILNIGQCVDRIYKTPNSEVQLTTANKRILIQGTGFDSIVVWNPWQEKALAMSDFDDLGYQNMLCIEMANTQGLTLAPKQSHQLVQTISSPISK